MSEGSSEFGHASIEPRQDVIAGQYGTWRLTYTAGSQGISAGGWLRVYTDADTDWAAPQFVEASGPDYMSVETPTDVDLAVRVESLRSLRVFVQGRDLAPSEQFTLVFGDTSQGSPGSRAQTFTEDKHFFWIDVDVDGDGTAVTLDHRPCLSIVGDQVKKFVVIAPSSVVVGESFRVLVKAEDRWGNPTTSYQGTVTLSGEGVEFTSPNLRFSGGEGGARWIEGCKATIAGNLAVCAVDADARISAQSNPVVASVTATEHQLHWADPHGGQLVLNSKIKDFFRYARDVSGVQFVGYQRNADVITDEDWEVQQREERDFHESGRFIPIPGFEWSGKTWHGGHHNVYFRRHDQPARRNMPAEPMFRGEHPAGELGHVRDVYRAYRNTDVIITPHVGGEHSDISHHDPTLEPAVEIVSSHGMFEWMLWDAIERGYKLGFLGGSDSYTARPGDDHPGYQTRRYSKAGLTGIYTDDVSLASFHEAMRARRVYATTGARMVLRVEADGHFMGSEYTTGNGPILSASVIGAAPLESVELFRGLECIHSVPLNRESIANRVRVLWRGGSRMTSYSGVVWDGHLRVKHARITKVETIRFDSPRSHIVEQTEESVRWTAWGCGYPMALVLELDDPAHAVFEISLGTQTITGPAYGGHGSHAPRRISLAPAENILMNVRVGELGAHGPAKVDIGVIDRSLEVCLDADVRSSTADFQFTDDAPNPGVNPYWVRVVQSDLETGWTSPVFVDYCPPVD